MSNQGNGICQECKRLIFVGLHIEYRVKYFPYDVWTEPSQELHVVFLEETVAATRGSRGHRGFSGMCNSTNPVPGFFQCNRSCTAPNEDIYVGTKRYEL